MGYIHNTAMCVFVPPEISQQSGGSWIHAATLNCWRVERQASAGQFTIKLPVLLPHQNAVNYRGAFLTSLDIWYKITTEALTSLNAAIQLMTLPANNTAFSAASKVFTYDADHNQDADEGSDERRKILNHKMTLTLTTPFWVLVDQAVHVELTGIAGASGVFSYHGCQAKYTLRI